jgi:hypothetical protein
MVMPRRPSTSLADREKKMRLWGPLTGGEGGLRTGAGRLQCGEERKKMLISQCHSVNTKHKSVFTSFFDSFYQIYQHPNNRFDIVTKYQYYSDLVFKSIQCQGFQYLYPNEALRKKSANLTAKIPEPRLHSTRPIS